MEFDTYDEFKVAVSSEKLSLIYIYPRKSINTWTLQGSNIWTKDLDGFVNKLYSGSTEITKQTSAAVDASNPFYYDLSLGRCYYYTTSTIPDDDNLIGEFKLFFSNAPINLSHDLGNTSEEVYYEPRVISGVGFNSQIGADQKGISITGKGTVKLQNNDGHFDLMFNQYVWENKRVEIYSYNRSLDPSSAELQYKGFIVDKSFNTDKVSFKINDVIFKTNTKVPMNLFTSADGVNDSYVGNVKRHIYGQVDGLLCRSIDQVGTGVTITGTVSGTAATQTVTGTGTIFLTELAQNDTITINSEDYNIESIASDTSLTISNTDGLAGTFVTLAATATFDIPNPEYNREFFVADHAISQKTTTITVMTQLNRLKVDDIDGFETGDTIKINGDSFTILNISGVQIQLAVNADEIYPIGATVTKEPITQIYLNGTLTDINDLSNVTNVTDCTFTINNKTEFRIAKDILINDANFVFTNGSRSITYTGSSDLQSIIQERDWIKVDTTADTTYIRVVDVVGTVIRTSTTWTGTTVSSVKLNRRRPDYIDDNFNVSIYARGKTKDGTATGELIETGADVVKDLLLLDGTGIELTDLDVTSFTEAASDASHRMSISIPYSIKGKAPTLKKVINDINTTVFGALALKQNMKLGYYINSPERVDTMTTISDDDVISWKIKGTETNSYKDILGSYRFVDFDNQKKEAGESLIDYSSTHIEDYDISNKQIDENFRVYTSNAAQELSERRIHYSEQSLMELTIVSDLRLSNLEIGDKVTVDFARFMFNPVTLDLKNVFTVTGVKKDWDGITLKLSNLGNLYVRSAVISDNSTPDWSSSTIADKTYNSYITDDNGLITGSEETKGNNLIS